MIQLEILQRYDATMWQVAEPIHQPGLSFILTWTVTPHPADAGVPAPIARILAEALISFGSVYFGGEPAPDEQAARVRVRRGLFSDTIAVVAAQSVDSVMPAFSCARHDWSQNAQWLIVTDKTSSPLPADILSHLVRGLYQDWDLPQTLPPGVAVIVQAAVDGDGAAFHCAHAREASRLMTFLETSARDTGASFLVQDAEGDA